MLVFFFQAEDGIRDIGVTGVQTCALPISGLVVSGTSPDDRLVEVIEIADHPFFVASQFHPEFKSRPERPSPLFSEFVAASLELAKGEERSEPVADPADGEIQAAYGTTTSDIGRFGRG